MNWAAFERYHSPKNSFPDYFPSSSQDTDAVPVRKPQMNRKPLAGSFRPQNNLNGSSSISSRRPTPPHSRERPREKAFDLTGHASTSRYDPPSKRQRLAEDLSSSGSSVNAILINDDIRDPIPSRPLRRRDPSATVTVDSESGVSESRRSILGAGIPELQQIERTLHGKSTRAPRGTPSSRSSERPIKKQKIQAVETISDDEVEEVRRSSRIPAKRVPYQGTAHLQPSRKLAGQTSKYFNFEDQNGKSSTLDESQARSGLKRHQRLQPRESIESDEVEVVKVAEADSKDSTKQPRAASDSLSRAGAIQPTRFQRIAEKLGFSGKTRLGSQNIVKLRAIYTERNDRAGEGDDTVCLKYDPILNFFNPYRGDVNLSSRCPALVIKPEKILRIYYAEDHSKIVIHRSAESAVPSTKLLIDLGENEDPGYFVKRLQGDSGRMDIYTLSSSKIDARFNNILSEAASARPRLQNPSHLVADTQKNQEDIREVPQSTRMDNSVAEEAPEGIARRMQKRQPSIEGNKIYDPSPSTEQTEPTGSARTRRQPFQVTSPLPERMYSTRSSTGSSRPRLFRSPTPPPVFDRWSKKNTEWKNEWGNSLVFPPEGKKKAMVDIGDIERLDEGEYLNDNLIVFYLRYLEEKLEREHPDIAKRVYFQNTYFYEALTKSKGRGINYEAVQRWTAKIDLFSYDYIIVPVNENAHWFLAIICNVPALLTPRIDITDSPLEEIQPKPSTPNGKQQESVDLVADSQGEEDTKPRPKDKTTPGPEFTSSMQSLSIDDTFPKADQPGEDSPVNPQAHEEVTTNGNASHEKETRSTPQVQDAGSEAATSSPLQSPNRVARKGKRKSFIPPVRRLDPKEPRILTLDSLALSHSPVCVNLREYLKAEAQARHGKDITDAVPQNFGFSAKGLPIQNNHCDCGMFVLAYAERFLRDPPSFVRDAVRKDMSVDTHWADLDVRAMRNDIRELIFKLQREQKVREQKEAEAKRRAKKAVKHAAKASVSSRQADSSADNKEEDAPQSSIATDDGKKKRLDDSKATGVTPGSSAPPLPERALRRSEVRDSEDDEDSPDHHGSAARADELGTHAEPVEIIDTQNTAPSTQDTVSGDGESHRVPARRNRGRLGTPEPPKSPQLLTSSP